MANKHRGSASINRHLLWRHINARRSARGMHHHGGSASAIWAGASCRRRHAARRIKYHAATSPAPPSRRRALIAGISIAHIKRGGVKARMAASARNTRGVVASSRQLALWRHHLRRQYQANDQQKSKSKIVKHQSHQKRTWKKKHQSK